MRCAAQAEHTGRVRRLETDLQATQAERDKGLGQLKELTKEHTDRVRQLREEFEAAEAAHATKLKKAEAKIQQLTDELQAEKGKRTAEVGAVLAIKAIIEALPGNSDPSGSPPPPQPSVTDMDVLGKLIS